MEKELQKMDPKNGFRDIKLGGRTTTKKQAVWESVQIKKGENRN